MIFIHNKQKCFAYYCYHFANLESDMDFPKSVVNINITYVYNSSTNFPNSVGKFSIGAPTPGSEGPC